MKLKMTSFFIWSLCCVTLLAVVLAGFLLLMNNTIPPSYTIKEAVNHESLIKVKKSINKTDEILVKFKNENEIKAIKIKEEEDYIKVLDDYNNSPEVEYAELNYIYRASVIPSDTYYDKQWYLQKIKAPEAWDQARESPNIVIAIMDSGVQINHPDLKDNIWRNKDEIENNGIDDDKNGFIDDVAGWDFINNLADPNPKFNDGYTEAGVLHGTVVAGVAAASGNNAAGISGVTWRANIMPLKVLDDNGEGNTNKVVSAIDYAIANGADIINLSFVGFGFSQSLDDAIGRAYKAGIIIVAAAGNEQEEGEGYFLDEIPMYPACHDGPGDENRVIGVAATDTLDQKTIFSSYGFKCVDISAPGVSIYSTVVYSPAHYLDGNYFDKYYDGYWSGTSMAAPIVSAAAALVEEANPGLSRNQVVSALLNNTDNINKLNPRFLNQLGKGRLNLAKAINYAKNSLSQQSTNLLISPNSDYPSIIKISDKNGKVSNQFSPYSDSFLGGASLSSGDVDGDGINEIVTGAGFSGGPHVKIFTVSGEVKGQFFAYDSHFRGGVNVAVGDVDGDGIDEIVTGAGFSGGPQVRIFKASGKVIGQFFAYDSHFRGGVNVAVGDIDGGTRSQRAEIITAAGKGGGPQIRIFDSQANLRAQFFAYNKTFRGGVSAAVSDIDSDGLVEIVTGAGPGGAPHVRVFKTGGVLIGSFYAYEEEFSGGVNVGIIEVRR